MTNHMQNAIKQIFENENLSKKLIKLETLDEILELFKSIDNNISKEDFEEGINELLEKSSEKLTDETLSEISGGALNKNFKKSLAATLAALSVGSSQIYAAPQTTSKTSKVISAAFLAALGVTGATALGAMLYHIMNKPGDLADTDLKDIYYGLLMDTNSEQLEEAFNALATLNGTNENFGQEFNKILKEKGIDPTQLKAGDAKELFKDKNFFISLPLSVIEKISPKEIRNKVEKIKSSKEEQSKDSTPETSTSEDSKQQASASESAISKTSISEDLKPQTSISESATPENSKQQTPTSKGSKQQTLTPGSSSFIKGLQNPSNYCHLNTVLQLLRQIPEVREGKVQPLKGAESNIIEKINSLNEVMKAINNSEGEIADDNFTKKERELLELLYPGTKKVKEYGKTVERECCELSQDASDTFLKLKLPYESLKISFIMPLCFSSHNDEEITNPVNEPLLMENSCPIESAKYIIFSIPEEIGKKFPETYTSNGQEFELKCVVCFTKLLNCNHYYAYSKGENNKWYICNDKHITGATFKDVKKGSSKAVMFLYSRVDKTQN